MNFFGILFNNSGHSHNNENKKLNRLHSIIYYLLSMDDIFSY